MTFASQVGQGRTSGFEAETDVSGTDSYSDPQNYQEALRTLTSLPAAPGQSCAALLDDGVKPGEIYRIEVYNDALLISVLVDEVRHEQRNLETLNRLTAEASEELKKTFPQEQELAEKAARPNALTLELDGSHSKGPVEPEQKNSDADLPILSARGWNPPGRVSVHQAPGDRNNMK